MSNQSVADEIKNLFIAELKNTNEWQETILLSNYIKQSIIDPGVMLNIIYTFSQPINIDIFKMAFKVQFGFLNDNISDTNCIINMNDFLN